jgi:hypothetical protein
MIFSVKSKEASKGHPVPGRTSIGSIKNVQNVCTFAFCLASGLGSQGGSGRFGVVDAGNESEGRSVTY